MNNIDWLEGLKKIYEEYPRIGSLFIVLFLISIVFYTHQILSRQTYDFRNLEIDFQVRRNIFSLGIIYIMIVVIVTYIATNFYDRFYSLKNFQTQVNGFNTVGGFCAIILFILYLVSSQIGNKLNRIHNDLSILLPHTLSVFIAIQISCIFAIHQALLFENHFLNILIPSSICSLLITNIITSGKRTQYSHSKLYNEMNELFIYYKRDNYYFCGINPSKVDSPEVILLSNDTIIENNFIILPRVGLSNIYTRTLSDKDTDGRKRYGLYVKNINGGAKIKNIIVRASFRDFWKRVQYRKYYKFSEILDSGDNKCIGEFYINNKFSVFQCSFEIISFDIVKNEYVISNGISNVQKSVTGCLLEENVPLKESEEEPLQKSSR